LNPHKTNTNATDVTVEDWSNPKTDQYGIKATTIRFRRTKKQCSRKNGQHKNSPSKNRREKVAT
jgi:hypothetical protein